MKRPVAWLLAGLLSLLALPAVAQERAWSEGPVTNVSAIKIVDGQFENYMEYLRRTGRS